MTEERRKLIIAKKKQSQHKKTVFEESKTVKCENCNKLKHFPLAKFCTNCGKELNHR